MVERRQHRSLVPSKAMALYLEALASRRRHRALALADRDGLLLAAAPSAMDCDALAAVAPLLYANPTAPKDGLLTLVTRHQPLSVWALPAEGGPYYLAAVDGDLSSPEEAQAALARIFEIDLR